MVDVLTTRSSDVPSIHLADDQTERLSIKGPKARGTSFCAKTQLKDESNRLEAGNHLFTFRLGKTGLNRHS